MRIFSSYSNRELAKVLLFSFLRYIVFTTQYILLLRLFGIQIPLSAIVLIIPIIYLISSAIPSIALVEFGVKGSIALFLFTYYMTLNADHTPIHLAIIATSTFIWAINLIIPALLGSIFVFDLTLFRKK